MGTQIVAAITSGLSGMVTGLTSAFGSGFSGLVQDGEALSAFAEFGLVFIGIGTAIGAVTLITYIVSRGGKR